MKNQYLISKRINTKKKIKSNNIKSPEEIAIKLIQEFLGFKINIEKTKFTEEELKKIVEFIKNNKLLKFFPFLAPLNMLVKISEANNHKISINDINQIISEAINSDVLPGYIITFLQCLIYNKATKSIKPKDVLNLLNKSKDINGLELEENKHENSDVNSTKRFICIAANIPLNEEGKINSIKKAIELKDNSEVEKILNGELYPLITDSLFARISPYYAKIYQKAKISKTNEYNYVEVEFSGLKAICVFKIQSVEDIKHKNKFDKCKFMQEAMVELEIIKMNENELKEILKKYVSGTSSDQLT